MSPLAVTFSTGNTCFTLA